MKKDLIRDYATEAFRLYARMGCPSLREIGGEGATAADLRAVSEVLRILALQGKEEVIAAVRAVYFVAPRQEIERGSISARVEAFAVGLPAAPSTVYRWLRTARDLFGKVRGLRQKR
ncbi:MAG: hypothetical protein E7590_07515 [Ruminococcaceae bacterium]|nr:hypothetical protein [Oscillospiraceae bacterium]